MIITALPISTARAYCRVVELDPVGLGKTIMRDYNKAQKVFRQALARQFVVGRQLLEIQQQLGEKLFSDWLTNFCPTISLSEARSLMDYSVQSGLAQKVDALLEEENS